MVVMMEETNIINCKLYGIQVIIARPGIITGGIVFSKSTFVDCHIYNLTFIMNKATYDDIVASRITDFPQFRLSPGLKSCLTRLFITQNRAMCAMGTARIPMESAPAVLSFSRKRKPEPRRMPAFAGMSG